MNKYKLSFTEINLGDIKLKNRIVSSPLSLNMSDDNGTVTDNNISFFSNLAKNNLGMIMVGNACISHEGKGAANEIVIGEKIHFKKLKQLAQSIKENDSIPCLQVSHIGAQGNTNYTGQRVVGPSEYIVPDIGIKAKVLDIDEIKNIENDFVKAILQAFDAGFELVDIMMAHGYLIHEFLSEHTNKRTDEYGGSIENRLRFIKNIITKLKKEINIKNLGARVSGNDFLPLGLSFNNIKFLIDYLDSENFSFYTVTAGIYETAKQKYINMKKGSYWDYAKNLKKLTNTPVIAQGNITSLTEGENILNNKQGDLWGMGQALIADPEIVTKTINNEKDDIYNCLAHIKVGSCHRCRYLKQKDHTFDCVTPGAWRPPNKLISKYERRKDLDFWKKIISKVKKLEN